MEQTVGYGHLEQDLHLAASAGLAKNCNIARIPAEGGDIIPHPFQCKDDVHHPQTARIPILLTIVGQIHESDAVQPVVQRHNDDISVITQIMSVIGRLFDGGTRAESAAVKPDHDRPAGVFVDVLTPHIEIQAVLAHRPVTVRHLK